MKYLKKLLYLSPIIIGFTYLLLGSLWIMFSDQFVFSLFDDPDSIATIQNIQLYKGWGFVAASSIFIYILVQINNNKLGDVISELSQTKKEQEAILEQAPVGIAYNRPNERWVKVNQKLCEMFEYNREELLNLNFEDFIHPDDLERGRQLDQKLITGEKNSFKMEKKYVKKSGEYMFGRVSKAAVYDENGSPLYIVAIVEDITREKITGEELQHALNQKELLLAEILHRVNNNLALIVACLDLELANIGEDHCRDLFKKSQMRIKSVGIVQRKLYEANDFSKLPIKDYIHDILSTVIQNWGNGNNKVSLQSNGEDVRLNVNQAIPCGLILNELVTNAYKHAFPEEKNDKITVSIRIVEDNIKLSVSDNGIGLPEEVNIKEAGTVGFTLVHTLCKQLDADVEIDRKNGTTFTISFQKKDKRGAASNL